MSAVKMYKIRTLGLYLQVKNAHLTESFKMLLQNKYFMEIWADGIWV